MPDLLNILLVCYYFPPLGGAGVQRPAKFAKYLSRFGHRVTVIAAQPMENELLDDSLLADIPDNVRVIRVKVRHPRNLVRWLPKRAKSDTPLSAKRGRVWRQVAAWSRLPDDKIGFVPGALAAAKRAFADAPPDVIITTSPPPSIHLVGRRLQKLWGVPWAADFRDPWFLAADEKLPTPVHRAIRSQLLGTTLRHADAVIAVSPGIIEDFRRWGFNRPDIEIITNGYDEDDFTGWDEQEDTLSSTRFTFHIYGTISPNAPLDPFLRALSTWLKAHPEMKDKIEISHRGMVIGPTLEELARKYDLPPRCASLGYAPHWYAVRELSTAHALVISVADRPGLRSNIPGRVYECLRSGRPILAFVPPDGAAAEVLKQFQGIAIINPHDEQTAVERIDHLLGVWQENQHPAMDARETVNRYSREQLTKRLSEIIRRTRLSTPQ